MVSNAKNPPSEKIVDSSKALEKILRRRVLINAGPMGTSVQDCNLGEQDFRGDLLRDHTSDLKGAIDILSITPCPIRTLIWAWCNPLR